MRLVKTAAELETNHFKISKCALKDLTSATTYILRKFRENIYIQYGCQPSILCLLN